MNKKKIAMEQQRVDSSNKKTIEGKSQNYNSLGIRYLLNEVKNFWMIVAKISTIASFILLITLMFYVQKNKYIPYVVQVNQEGAVLNSGVINKSSEVTANEKEIKYFLNQFIFNLSIFNLIPPFQFQQLFLLFLFLHLKCFHYLIFVTFLFQIILLMLFHLQFSLNHNLF